MTIAYLFPFHLSYRSMSSFSPVGQANGWRWMECGARISEAWLSKCIHVPTLLVVWVPLGFLQNSCKRSLQISFEEKLFGKTKKHLSPNDTLPLWSLSGKFHCWHVCLLVARQVAARSSQVICCPQRFRLHTAGMCPYRNWFLVGPAQGNLTADCNPQIMIKLNMLMEFYPSIFTTYTDTSPHHPRPWHFLTQIYSCVFWFRITLELWRHVVLIFLNWKFRPGDSVPS